jgi:hypothetical protein
MSATTTVVVPVEKAEHIDNIFAGLVALGAQHTMSSDGVCDGIALQPVFKARTGEVIYVKYWRVQFGVASDHFNRDLQIRVILKAPKDLRLHFGS